MIAERAAGNPFFVEEMVRELADRGVLRGNRAAYVSTADAGEVSVPATLQATIAARIDRLDSAAKRTLSAAAVIGSRFSQGVLEMLGVDPVAIDARPPGPIHDQGHVGPPHTGRSQQPYITPVADVLAVRRTMKLPCLLPAVMLSPSDANCGVWQSN